MSELPFPTLIFEGQLKTRHAPGTSFEPYPIPVLAEPKRVLAAFERLRSSVPIPMPNALTSPPRTPQ